MSATCPHCGQPMPERDPVGELRRWCQANGHHVTADGAVYEDAAAAILDRSAGTLRNWRSSGAGSALPFYRSGRTGRVRYRLTDLAELLEVQRRDA
jgi:hypothetical protein